MIKRAWQRFKSRNNAPITLSEQIDQHVAAILKTNTIVLKKDLMDFESYKVMINSYLAQFAAEIDVQPGSPNLISMPFDFIENYCNRLQDALEGLVNTKNRLGQHVDKLPEHSSFANMLDEYMVQLIAKIYKFHVHLLKPFHPDAGKIGNELKFILLSDDSYKELNNQSESYNVRIKLWNRTNEQHKDLCLTINSLLQDVIEYQNEMQANLLPFGKQWSEVALD